MEFSKNPLGKKRDRNGNLIDHSKSFPRYQPMDISGILPEQIATVPSTVNTTVAGVHIKNIEVILRLQTYCTFLFQAPFSLEPNESE